MTTIIHPDQARSVATALLEWFDSRERDVPWRDESDPYRIWVAEVMAQQTRMETVGPYYERFIERFPSVERLAAAPIDDVLRIWQGLGYYARARHLHAAASQIVERHGGELPSDVEALRALSGVGPYTAGAVASIAFGVAEPAVDGNARRLFSRLADIEDPTPARLDDAARAVVEAGAHRPAAVNQAIMDLGGSVCTPRNPGCEECPLTTLCVARAAGTVHLRPPRKSRGATPVRHALAAAVSRDGAFLFVRRPARGLLGGLWDLPATEPDADPAVATDKSRLERETRERLGVAIALEQREALATVRHTFSHFRIELTVLHAIWVSGELEADAFAPPGIAGVSGVRARWLGPDRFGEVAVPTYLRSVLPSLGQGTS